MGKGTRYPLSRKLQQRKNRKRTKKQPKGQKTLFRTKHALRRLEERYGITLNEHAFKALLKKIQEKDHPEALFLHKQSNTRTLWALKIEDKWAVAVYHKQQHYIPTFLPQEVLERFRPDLAKQQEMCYNPTVGGEVDQKDSTNTGPGVRTSDSA